MSTAPLEKNLPVLRAALKRANVLAFLRLLRTGETAQTEDAYRWLFGSTVAKPKLFDNFADHPRVRTYEAYDGQFIQNGKIDYTTAAGAYQITESTWDGLVRQYGFTEFDPATQDLAAVALILEKNALGEVIAGDIDGAIAKLRPVWASLPGASHGDQPTVKLERAREVYLAYGGQLANGVATPTPAPTPVEPSPPATAPLPVQATQTASKPARSPSTTTRPIPPEESMAPAIPLLISLAGNLIEAFAPLAREKVTKELAKHSDSPEVAAQVASSVINAVTTLTGKADPIDAVAAAKADPTIIQKVQATALEELEKLAPFLEKLAAFERETWAAEGTERDAAAARAKAEEVDLARPLMRASLNWVIGLMAILGTVAVAQVVKQGKVDTEVWSALTVVAGWIMSQTGGIFNYRFGTSRSSGAKDVLIDRLSQRPKA